MHHFSVISLTMIELMTLLIHLSIMLIFKEMLNPEKSTTTKLSSLRDILLKSSAINFDKIFFDADHVQGGGMTLNTILCFNWRKILKSPISLII